MSAVVRRAAGLLGVAALLSMTSIVVLHERSAERIGQVQAERLDATLRTLLPSGLDSRPSEDRVRVVAAELGTDRPLPVYRARVAGAVVLSVISAVAPDGYSGMIQMLVAVDNEGGLRGVRVTEHRETPGLGDAIEVRRSPWILQFGAASDQPTALTPGNSSERIALKHQGGEFEAITGATITSVAITRRVNRVHQWYRQHAAEIAMLPVDSVWRPETPE